MRCKGYTLASVVLAVLMCSYYYTTSVRLQGMQSPVQILKHFGSKLDSPMKNSISTFDQGQSPVTTLKNSISKSTFDQGQSPVTTLKNSINKSTFDQGQSPVTSLKNNTSKSTFVQGQSPVTTLKNSINKSTFVPSQSAKKANTFVPGQVFLDTHRTVEQSNETSVYDIMNTKPIRFLSNFKNPCWYGEKDNGPINDNKLHCLPYFYLIGIKKSGTGDLFSRISAHPDIANPGFKEAQWFARRRFGLKEGHLSGALLKQLKGKDVRGIQYYISMFDSAAKKIGGQTPTLLNNNKYYDRITAEGSPSNLHMNLKWETLPGNEGLMDPRYTILHYIQHLVPNVKILIIIRDPVERLLSDYMHTARHFHIPNLSPQTFHARVKFEVEAYKKCFQEFSMRRCIYNSTLYNYTHVYDMNLGGFDFNVSFYAFHMKELLSVFRKDQILPILMMDYIQDRNGTMMKIFDFLGLNKLDPKTMNYILTKQAQIKFAASKIKFGPMLDETKQLLRDFLRPFNEEMATLMNDSRYLFEPPAAK